MNLNGATDLIMSKRSPANNDRKQPGKREKRGVAAPSAKKTNSARGKKPESTGAFRPAPKNNGSLPLANALKSGNLTPKDRKLVFGAAKAVLRNNGGPYFPPNPYVHQNAPVEPAWWEKGLSIAMDWLPKVIPLLLGFGDYKVNSNSIMAAASGGRTASQAPQVKNTKHGMIVSHREYLGDVLSSTAPFTVEEFSLNPGLQNLCPWASTVANAFQQYQWRGAVFEFLSKATDYASQPYLGYVAMGTQYDSLEPEFASKLALLNNEMSTDGKTSLDFCHPIECNPDETSITKLYTRNGPIPNPADIKTYDLGVTTLAVGGQTASGSIIGELWFCYEVEFFKPQLADQIGYDANSASILFKNHTNVAPFGNLSSSQGNVPVVLTGTNLTFPSLSDGVWVVIVNWVGTTGAAFTAGGYTTANCALTNDITAPDQAGPVVKSAVYSVVMRVTGPGPSMTTTGSWSLPTGTVGGSVDLYQLYQLSHADSPIVSRWHLNGGDQRPVYVPGEREVEVDVVLPTPHQLGRKWSVDDTKIPKRAKMLWYEFMRMSGRTYGNRAHHRKPHHPMKQDTPKVLMSRADLIESYHDGDSTSQEDRRELRRAELRRALSEL